MLRRNFLNKLNKLNKNMTSLQFKAPMSISYIPSPCE